MEKEKGDDRVTEKEISGLAFRQTELPKDASWTDKMLWHYLSVLYRLSAENAITPSEGKDMKLRFVTAWDYVNTKLETLGKIAEHDANNWLKLEPFNQKYQELRQKYENDKNTENAEALIKAADEFRKEVYAG